jgi:hypothetical protein
MKHASDDNDGLHCLFGALDRIQRECSRFSIEAVTRRVRLRQQIPWRR